MGSCHRSCLGRSGRPIVRLRLTLNVLHDLPWFTKFHQPLAHDFMKNNSDIKISFLAPATNYNEAQQEVLRAAVTGILPDVYFSGCNLTAELVRTLEPRHQIASLGQVDGKPSRLSVNASSPLLFVKADLVRKAGGDPTNPPKTFPGLIARAKTIHSLDVRIAGMGYDINGWPDDWLW